MKSTISRLLSVEFRAELSTPDRLRGHAGVFNRMALVENNMYEEIGPTAFDEVLRRGDDTRFLLNHNPNNLLGRTASGTLRLRTDTTGLEVDNDLPDTTLGRDVRVLVARRDLTGFSFGYAPDEQSDTFRVAPDGRQVVTRNNMVRLVDVSLATYPAYAEADDAVLRSIDFTRIVQIDQRSQLIRARSRAQKG
jgi:HK97 family phage prohead protease